ncbi:MAG TPA: helix-turn-helix transcriptional regulator [Pyrinomonadaceae bacterium]
MKKNIEDLYNLMRTLLVEAREGAGLSQQDVAARMGKHQTFVSKVEQGQRRLDLIEFLQMAEVLGIDAHSFIRKLTTNRPRK